MGLAHVTGMMIILVPVRIRPSVLNNTNVLPAKVINVLEL